MGLIQTIRLAYVLAKTDFKLRNEGSYLGVLWYLFNPLLMFLLLLLIFSDRLGNKIPYYPIYLLTGIIIFNFFQQATIESTICIINNNGLIKSIQYPKEALVLGIVLKVLFSHMIELSLLFILTLIYGLQPIWLVFYPILLSIMVFFIFGAALILSTITVYVSDMSNVWAFLLKLIWLGTPIFYEIGGQTKLFYVSLLNPLYYIITAAREIIINSSPPASWLIIGAIFYSTLSFLLGIILFNKYKDKFPELI